MITPVLPFTQCISDAGDGIEAAAADEAAIQRTLASGCGVLHGYYLAGGVSKFEYEAGCTYLRRIASQRLAMLQLQRDAVEAGVVDDE